MWRRAYVEGQLTEHPEERVAVHVAEAPLLPGPGAPVSVVIAIRTRAGTVTAELHVPRERWDPTLFMRALSDTAKCPS